MARLNVRPEHELRARTQVPVGRRAARPDPIDLEVLGERVAAGLAVENDPRLPWYRLNAIRRRPLLGADR